KSGVRPGFSLIPTQKSQNRFGSGFIICACCGRRFLYVLGENPASGFSQWALRGLRAAPQGAALRTRKPLKRLERNFYLWCLAFLSGTNGRPPCLGGRDVLFLSPL